MQCEIVKDAGTMLTGKKGQLIEVIRVAVENVRIPLRDACRLAKLRLDVGGRIYIDPPELEFVLYEVDCNRPTPKFSVLSMRVSYEILANGRLKDSMFRLLCENIRQIIDDRAEAA